MLKPLMTVGVLTLGLAQAAYADMVTKPIRYSVGNTAFESTLVYDDSSDAKRPAVLMVPNWLGPNEANLAQAELVAGTDYVVLMADMYGADVRPTNSEEAGAAAGAVRSDRAMMRERVNAALDVLLAQAETAPIDLNSVAAIGFCFGGGTVLELARSGRTLDAVVSFHGNLDTPNPADAQAIDTGILVLHGADDPSVTQESVQAFVDEMQAVDDLDWQLVQFGGAVHSFTDPDANNPGRNEYNEKVAKRAYAAMALFLADRFRM